jgi:hypothetical protein
MGKIPARPVMGAAKPKVEQASGAELPFVDLEHDSFEDFKDINMSTMAVPFVRILQALSPQTKKNDDAYVDGAEEGLWFNTVTRHVYGDTILFIPLKFEHVFIEWRPERGGFVGYHDPSNAERLAVDKAFGKWRTAEGNILQENYVYMGAVDGFESEGVVVLSLASSMIKTAKNWNKLMTSHVMSNGQKARPYYLVWCLKTEYVSNDKGSWYVPSVKFEKYITEAQYSLVKKEQKALPARQVDYALLESEKAGEAVAEDSQF